MLRCLASLASDSIIALRDYGITHGQLLINENIVDIIPQYEAHYYNSDDEIFEEPMAEAFRDLITYESILLSRNGVYLAVEDAYYARIAYKRAICSFAKKQQ